MALRLPTASLVASHRRVLPRLFSTTSDPSKPNYPHFEVRQTRFNDMDMFGHMNNTIYYNLMDDAINVHLIHRGIGRQYARFIAENGVQFFRPIQYPNNVCVGIQVVKLTSKAATYDVGFYEVVPGKNDDPLAEEEPALAARGKFVHVYVNEKTGRPVEIAPEARAVLETLVVTQEEGEEKK